MMDYVALIQGIDALQAEVASLEADRRALLGLWITPNRGRYQIRGDLEGCPPTFDTWDQAAAAVLAWAHSQGGD